MSLTLYRVTLPVAASQGHFCSDKLTFEDATDFIFHGLALPSSSGTWVGPHPGSAASVGVLAREAEDGKQGSLSPVSS